MVYFGIPFMYNITMRPIPPYKIKTIDGPDFLVKNCKTPLLLNKKKEIVTVWLRQHGIFLEEGLWKVGRRNFGWEIAAILRGQGIPFKVNGNWVVVTLE